MINFQFKPKDFVQIKAFGLDYRARVQRAIWDGDQNIYSVQYVEEGTLKSAEFFEDELEKSEP